MTGSRKKIIIVVLIFISLLIHLFSLRTQWVENLYSNGIYHTISKTLRTILGWIPISIGDILYGLVVVTLLWTLVRSIRYLSKKKPPTAGRFNFKLWRVVVITGVVYIIFNLFWGLNYNRKGISSQLGLTLEKYTDQELKDITCQLIDKINKCRSVLSAQNNPVLSNRELFQKVSSAYSEAEKQYPFLIYQPPSIKPSLWGWLGNYSGFNGYYNPFTGEAQLNTTIPHFLQPFIACHEVAHQVGYAKEMEANFVGYLAASASRDTLFHYSVYLDLYAYANRNLYKVDSVSSKLYFKELNNAVRDDIDVWRKFNRKHINPAEPIIRWVYGKFLQSNQQPEGMMAYDRVTAFIIAYYKKFGKI